MIKIIAFLTMFIDHIGVILFPDIIIYRIIGRLSFPLFAWGIVKGYKCTNNFNKYAIRLLIIGVISQIPYFYLFANGFLNVCFTLFTGLITLKIYDSKFKSVIKSISIFLILVLSEYLNLEYGAYGILMIILFLKYWNSDYMMFYQAALTLFSILIFKYHPIQLFSIFSSLIILILNSHDFKLCKLFQYSFYPIHMIILLFFR